MRRILLGFLLHWKDQLPEGGVPVYPRMVKKQVSVIQTIEHYVRLQVDGELLQEVESTMVSAL